MVENTVRLRYCQLALWGALVKPSSKDTTCQFIANQLATSLLTATGNLTSSLGNKLDNILPLSSHSGGSAGGGGIATQLNQIGITPKKQMHKSSSATANNQRGNGILGLGIL